MVPEQFLHVAFTPPAEYWKVPAQLTHTLFASRPAAGRRENSTRKQVKKVQLWLWKLCMQLMRFQGWQPADGLKQGDPSVLTHRSSFTANERSTAAAAKKSLI